jgi:hypothetical protein
VDATHRIAMAEFAEKAELGERIGRIERVLRRFEGKPLEALLEARGQPRLREDEGGVIVVEEFLLFG